MRPAGEATFPSQGLRKLCCVAWLSTISDGTCHTWYEIWRQSKSTALKQ